MKLSYDTDKDVLSIRFNDFPIVRSTTSGNGTILDFDRNGRLVAIEIVPASEMVGSPCIVEVGDHKSLIHLTGPTRTVPTTSEPKL